MFICLLLRRNELSHYGGVISYYCKHLRFCHLDCILQSHKIWTFEVFPLRFDILNYLIPMWYVCSNKFHFSFWLSFGSCLFEFAWCGFSLISISIYYVGNHLFHLILTMALPVGSNSWNYQQTVFKIWCFISYLLPYAYLLWSWSWTSFLYTTEKYLYILLVHDKWC